MLWDRIKLFFGGQKCVVKPASVPKAPVSFFDLYAKTISGEKFHFSQLKGKKTLIINTASKCSYTDQYTILESFHQTYGNSVTVLGFPCNDFLGQEPESETKIMEFCSINYGVSFQLFEKMTLKGESRSQVYDWLGSRQKNGWSNHTPTWNFCKYLVDENGELLLFASSSVLPTHKDFMSLIDG
ncbi:MAG: glutathione peroxidase [Bacteroidetes bacterium]|jgi:glutathione peroxidase|nr:glutathione peroxidase [Bacteroidota bacterium]